MTARLASAAQDAAEPNAATEARALPHRFILGMRVDALEYADLTERVMQWAHAGQSRYVCVGTVHMVMETHDGPPFRADVNAADIVTPDGMPLVWGLRMLGLAEATRVYGPEVTLRVCAQAAEQGVAVGFYGGSPAALSGMLRALRDRYPGLRISYAYSPPYRELTDLEEAEVIDAIRRSGAQVLFVGLGCPKQETWMGRHRNKVDAVMLGVGAAFDFLGGVKRQAPRPMQRMGLEWLFRLLAEPRRLWRRYLFNNPRFLAGFARQLIRHRFGGE